MTGKNLINVAEGTEVTSNSSYTVPNVNAGQLYTITLSQTLISADGRKGAQHQIRYIDSDGNEIKRNNIVTMEFTAVGDTRVKTQTISLPENTKSIVLDIGAYYGSDSPRLKTNYCQFEAGSIASAYEPYQSKSASITLTESLHGTGECRDRIACKDGEWGIERYIGVVDNGQWRKLNVASGSAGHRFVYDATDMIEKLNCMVICSKYTRRPKGASFNAIGDYVATDEVGKIFIRTLNPDFETIEAFREFIADAITLYPLAVPTWTPLPSATQQALNELTTYAGTTHLTITAGGSVAGIDAEYVQDINGVIAELLRQIEELRNAHTK